MKSVLKLRKNGVFENESSFVDLTVAISFHCDTKSLVDCQVCGSRRYSFIPSVDSIQVENIQPRNFSSSAEEKDALNRIKVRLEQSLRGLTSCTLAQEADQDHKNYIKSLFAFNSNYVFSKIDFAF